MTANEIGNKAYNLTLLQKLGMPVPTFFPFTHEAILALLKICGFDTKQKWQQIVNLYNPKQHTCWLDFLNTLDKQPNGLLYILRSDIEKITQSPKFIEELKQKYKSELDRVINATNFTIVRSSGFEDCSMSDKGAANQGGNESHPASTEYSDIAKKIGLVISSGFKMKSLQQRSLKESTTDLQRLPMTSLFVQGLITDNNLQTKKTQISSGVIFTEEPIFYTPGVMAINSAFGHGQGVVENQVPIDTFYVLDNVMVLSSIKNKPCRITPRLNASGNLELFQTNNSAAQSNESSLPLEAILELRILCNKIMQEFGKTKLDIEWVYNWPSANSPGKMYIVQVRELPPIDALTQNPEYINIGRVAADRLILNRIKMRVSGGNEILQINNTSEIILATDIRQALIKYHQHPQKEQIKAIIVENDLALTSHEAGVCKSIQMPVFTVDNAKKFATNIQSTTFVIDQQNGLALKGDRSKFAIGKGLCRHPIDLPFSFEPVNVSEQEILRLIDWCQPINSEVNGLKINAIINKLSLINAEIIATSEITIDMKPLVHQVLTLYANLLTKARESTFSIEVINDLKRMFGNSMQICLTIRTMLNRDLVHKKFLLFMLGTLRKTLEQQQADMYQHSDGLVAIINELKQQPPTFVTEVADDKQRNGLFGHFIKLALNVQDKSSDEREKYNSLLLNLGKMLWNTQTRDKWNLFVGSLSLPELQQLGSIAAECKNLNMLDYWLQTLFKQGQIAGVALLKQKLLKDRIRLNLIKNLEDNIIIKTQVLAWKNPANFDSRLEQFKELAIDINNAFTAAKKESSLMIRYKLISLVERGIQIVDSSLKEISGSTEYATLELKVKHFYALLKIYESITKAICMQFYKPDYQKSTYAHSAAYFLAALAKTMDACINDIKAGKIDTLLLPTHNFYVGYGIISNEAATAYVFEIGEDRHLSMEDLFTLCHQNLAFVCVQFKKTLGMDVSILPLPIQPLANSLSRLRIVGGYDIGKAELLGVNRDEHKIQTVITIPLSMHAAQIYVNYDTKNPNNVQIKVKIYLGDEGGRFRFVFKNSRLSALCNGFIYHQDAVASDWQLFHDDNRWAEIGFSWDVQIPQANIEDKIAKHITFILEDTFKGLKNASEREFPENIDSFIAGTFDDGLDGADRVFYDLVGNNMPVQACAALMEIFNTFKTATFNKYGHDARYFNFDVRDNFNRARLVQNLLRYLTSLVDRPDCADLAKSTINSIFSEPPPMPATILTSQYITDEVIAALCKCFPEVKLPGLLRAELLRRETKLKKSGTATIRITKEQYEHDFLELCQFSYDPNMLKNNKTVCLRAFISLHDMLDRLDDKIDLKHGSLYDPWQLDGYNRLLTEIFLNNENTYDAFLPPLQRLILKDYPKIFYYYGQRSGERIEVPFCNRYPEEVFNALLNKYQPVNDYLDPVADFKYLEILSGQSTLNHIRYGKNMGKACLDLIISRYMHLLVNTIAALDANLLSKQSFNREVLNKLENIYLICRKFGYIDIEEKTNDLNSKVQASKHLRLG